jgi:hypothetical protein
MHSLKSAVLIAAAMFGVATSAFAGAGIINTNVAALADGATVTYSRTAASLVTYLGYSVSIANGGGNTVNNIVVRFFPNAPISDKGERATFSSAQGANCQPNAQFGTIDCTIGQLTADAAFPTFQLFFQAPNQSSSNLTGTSLVSFAGQTLYAEQLGGYPQSPPPNSVSGWNATGIVNLGTTNPINVKSVVPKTKEVYLYTGDVAGPKQGNPFTTAVTVPDSVVYPINGPTTYTTAEISLTFDSNPASCFNFIECGISTITIPGTFSPYLAIVLRMDATNIKPGTKINNVLVNYVGDLGVTPPPGGWPYIVQDCGSTTTPRNDGLPCIAKRTYYKNRSVSGWTQDLDGDFEWQILNIWNGRYGTP